MSVRSTQLKKMNEYISMWNGLQAVSYTHLDVYKRQDIYSSLELGLKL